MLRCEESSDAFQSLATLQLKSWFPVAPLKCWGPEGSEGVYDPNQCFSAATQRFTVEDFNPFFLAAFAAWICSRWQKWASNISWWIAWHEVTHGVVALVYINPKMANGFRFFLVNKNISSCQVDHLCASCEYFAVSPAGSGTSETSRGRRDFSHPQQRGSGHNIRPWLHRSTSPGMGNLVVCLHGVKNN